MLKDFCLWLGVLIPMAMIAVGAVCITNETAWIPGRSYHRGMSLHGTAGYVMGAMFIVWAIGLHVRHFWGYVEQLEWWAHHVSILAYVAATALGVWLLTLFASAAFG